MHGGQSEVLKSRVSKRIFIAEGVFKVCMNKSKHFNKIYIDCG